MKYLKRKNISKFSISDNTLLTNDFGRAIMDLTGGLRIPKGTTAQRPQLNQVPNGSNGMIRYNTDPDPVIGGEIGVEVYINSRWEVIRAPGATTIYKQTIGPGNYSEIYFGPLDRIPASEDNILVFVENVFQISQTNFELETNPPGVALATYGTVTAGSPYPAGTYLKFQEAVPNKYVTVYFGFAN